MLSMDQIPSSLQTKKSPFGSDKMSLSTGNHTLNLGFMNEINLRIITRIYDTMINKLQFIIIFSILAI
jgi:hypothetical protein